MSRLSFIKQVLFSGLRRRVLGPFAQGVIYRTANGQLAAPLEDVSVGKALGFKGGYDTGEINELLKLITPNDVIFVVGTHIGSLLIPITKSCRQVVGYEANPDTFQFLKLNVLLNDAANVRLYNLAVGDSARTIEFYQNRSNSGGSKIKPQKDQYYYTYDAPQTIRVPMVSLDEHIRGENLPAPTGIIMDIEGAEYLALKGAQKTLAAARYLYIEFVPHHLENVAGVSNAEFFAQLIPHFDEVRFMRTRPGVIGLKEDKELFLRLADEYRREGRSDDLLFLKKS
jgi:FkbM family methyltransferase